MTNTQPRSARIAARLERTELDAAAQIAVAISTPYHKATLSDAVRVALQTAAGLLAATGSLSC